VFLHYHLLFLCLSFIGLKEKPKTTSLYKILTLGSSTLILVVQLSIYYMPIGLFLSYIYNKIQGSKGASFCGLITASVTLDITIVLRGKISDLVP
jgi:hypothetical protein